MFSTHWPHKMCTVVANHSLHCATNLMNHHIWSRTRYIKLDAWNAWQKDDILLCCMMFSTHWPHKMCKVVANHSLHCATNLKNYHTWSRIRYIKLDAWNAWQEYHILLCCMMFTTHGLHKMCTVVANHSLHCATNLKNYHTWSRIRYIKLDAWNAWQEYHILLCCMMFTTHGLHKMCTVVANHSLHCATNLKNHHTWSEIRYIKLDAWNAWQKDDILLCCKVFTSHWPHKMCKVCTVKPNIVCTVLPTWRTTTLGQK